MLGFQLQPLLQDLMLVFVIAFIGYIARKLGIKLRTTHTATHDKLAAIERKLDDVATPSDPIKSSLNNSPS